MRLALVTPMYPDGRVNYSALRQLIEYQIQHGADAPYSVRHHRRAPAWTIKSTTRCLPLRAKAIAGRVPFIAGTGSSIRHRCHVWRWKPKQCGADALLLVTPYYNKTNQAGLVRHYTAIADAAGLPVIVYNVPSRTE